MLRACLSLLITSRAYLAITAVNAILFLIDFNPTGTTDGTNLR
uniref:Uncharacterized protein n=1 Tax=Leclercia adecarboxylata TaxID=83655 RepID=A0A6H0A3Y9_9ENTR|nr:hypothetical protein [Leclercia adecarboxylata]